MKCTSNHIHQTPDGRKMVLSCGKCLACSITRQRGWILRLLLEQKGYARSSFVTLTYEDDKLPSGLPYEHIQLYLKRLRKSSEHPIRFFCCGEYGPRTRRPHWHLILLGYEPPILESDRFIKPHLRSSNNEQWPYGFSVIGTVTEKSIGYVTRYSLKKLKAEEEVVRCSQGLAKLYFEDLASHLVTKTLEKSSTKASGQATISLPWHLKVGQRIYPIHRSCRMWMKRKVIAQGHIPKDMSVESHFVSRSKRLMNVLVDSDLDYTGHLKLHEQYLQGKPVLTSFDDHVMSEGLREHLQASSSGTL